MRVAIQGVRRRSQRVMSPIMAASNSSGDKTVASENPTKTVGIVIDRRSKVLSSISSSDSLFGGR